MLCFVQGISFDYFYKKGIDFMNEDTRQSPRLTKVEAKLIEYYRSLSEREQRNMHEQIYLYTINNAEYDMEYEESE